MSQKNIKNVLMDFGLSNKESQIYIFLAKHGVLKAGEIAKLTKTPRPLVYRILRNLQRMSLVESTLESPTRFIALPFEKALNSFIETKRREISTIEERKSALLNDWLNIKQTELESEIERFSVIEGNKKIFQKISQMIKETKHQLCGMLVFPVLLRADKFGVFEASPNKPKNSIVNLCFLTEVYAQNLDVLKKFYGSIPTMRFSFKMRNPQFGLKLSPQLVIRDDEEAIFFITPQKRMTRSTNEVCLWTNCKALIKAFQGVFMELWNNSIDIADKISDRVTSSQEYKTCILSDEETAKSKYYDILESAEKEVTVITSSHRLFEFWRNKKITTQWKNNGILVRIMAPIVTKNWETANKLAKHFDVRHISKGHLETAIVDDKHLFQFRYFAPDQQMLTDDLSYSNMFYSTDPTFVIKTKSMLERIWENAPRHSQTTLNSIQKQSNTIIRHDIYKRTTGYIKDPELGIITEKDVLNKIISAKRYPSKNWEKDSVRYYGSLAQAIIHPPEDFKIPDMLVLIFHNNKQSSFGAEDVVNFFLWLNTPKGDSFVPVAVIQDNPSSVEFRKTVYEGTPAENNIQVVSKDELQVRVHGDTMFVGWTVPVLLSPKKYSLPPSAILFEGYGDLKTELVETTLPSGRKQIQERNFFEAFVTFLHPESKYAGPGTDGLLSRDVVFTSIPSADNKK